MLAVAAAALLGWRAAALARVRSEPTNAATPQLATLKAEREASPAVGDGAPTNLARERELKSLVQQFTRDSRKMLSCIQSLESEKRELRASFGGAAKSAA